MGLLKVTTLSLAVLFTLSCAPPDPPPPQKTVFDPLTHQLDRARDVQNTVDAQAQAARKAIDAQERGDSAP
ncbi:MAG TPA: hypothetical protein VN692_21620 [Steroidobacteraceae bacterium]|jgi:hypothetical protein|nr:hypothetical protein [Steroidobacteraceae bacterium]